MRKLTTQHVTHDLWISSKHAIASQEGRTKKRVGHLSEFYEVVEAPADVADGKACRMKACSGISTFYTRHAISGPMC